MFDLFFGVQCSELHTSCVLLQLACRSYMSQDLLLYLCNKHCVNNLFVDVVQKSFNEATRSSFQEYCLYTLKFAADRV